MIIALLFEVFIKAFLLLILLYIVARDEADFDFRKVTMVTAGIVLGAVILDAVLTRFIGMFTIIPVAAFVVFMVMQFCWVRFWRSLLVAIPFLVLNIMISTSVASFQQKADAAVARGLQGPVKEEDMKEALGFLKQSFGENTLQIPMERQPPKMEESLNQILIRTLLAGITSKKLSLKPASGPKMPQSVTRETPKEGLEKKAQANMEKPAALVEERPAEAESDSPDWEEAGKKLSVKGSLIGKDGVRVAIVNNQMVREGEFIQVEHEKMIYRWRAVLIRAKSVSWEPIGTSPR